MEEMKKDMGMGMNNHGASCSCGSCGMMGRNMCGMCGGRRFWVLRWLLGIVILVIVFSLGVKVGEFKGYFQNSYGGGYGYGSYGHMSHHGMMYGQYPERMMTEPATQVTPTTTTSPTK